MTAPIRPVLLAIGLVIAALVGYSMVSKSSGKFVTVDCAAGADAALPPGFAADFCSILGDELNRYYLPSKGPAHVEVTLSRVGPFALTARVKVIRKSRANGSQDFNLSVRDSNLRPSIAKTLVHPVLKLLE